jgi:protocatechuate 3,4-dioxygenase beta subunit
MVLFLYHTDASGFYNHPNSPLNPRLYGWVRTESTGHYEFESIRPAAYPSHTEPAHIHVHVFGPNRPEWFTDEFRFADDRAPWKREGRPDVTVN